MSDLPLISCMCVTRGSPQLVARAVANFEKQDYPKKELVIVTEQPRGTLDYLPDHIVRSYIDASDGHVPVGTQRNICRDLCIGEFVAIWDDDDFFAPDRLSFSLKCLQKTQSFAFALFHETLLTNAGTVHKSVPHIWGNSFFAGKKLMERTPFWPVQLGEDTTFIRLFRHHNGPKSIYLCKDYSRYVYVQHPAQTTSVHPEHRDIWKNQLKEQLPEDEALQILKNCGALPLYQERNS